MPTSLVLARKHRPRPLPVCQSHDPEIWFPLGETHKADQMAISLAKALCDVCPFKQICLAWALDHGVTDGIWGGKTSSERRAMTRQGELSNAPDETRKAMARVMASA